MKHMLQMQQRNPARDDIGDPRLRAFAWDYPESMVLFTTVSSHK
jgi:hypothetical protein